MRGTQKCRVGLPENSSRKQTPPEVLPTLGPSRLPPTCGCKGWSSNKPRYLGFSALCRHPTPHCYSGSATSWGKIKEEKDLKVLLGWQRKPANSQGLGFHWPLFKIINADIYGTVEEMPFWPALATESYGKLFHLEDVEHGYCDCHLMGQGTKRDLPLSVRASSLQTTNISFYV